MSMTRHRVHASAYIYVFDKAASDVLNIIIFKNLTKLGLNFESLSTMFVVVVYL